MSPLAAGKTGSKVINQVDGADLSQAMRAGDLDEVWRALATHGVDMRLPRGRTPLMTAAADDNLLIAAALLEHGAEVDLTDFDGRTALHYAAGSGSDGIIEQLLAAGARLEAPDRDGRTPLWHAASHTLPDSPAVDLLLRAGADRFARDRNGVCPEDLL